MLAYEKDVYSNFVLKSKDLNIDVIQNMLPIFLTKISNTYPGQAVKVDVDYKDAAIIPLLKKLGFDFSMVTMIMLNGCIGMAVLCQKGPLYPVCVPALF